MDGFGALRAAWQGDCTTAPSQSRTWPREGVAIEGDFSGIQRFVLRPVPGAAGAARRLRARSFRVSSLTHLVAEAVKDRFKASNASLFYSAGGRFLVVMPPSSDWQTKLQSLQTEIDEDLLTEYRGELVFHLAGAEFSDGRIPNSTLRQSMGTRKQTPLSGALRSNAGWTTNRFAFVATLGEKCQGCGATGTLFDKAEKLCQTCVDDRELGKTLMTGKSAALSKSSSGVISLLKQNWKLASTGEVPITLLFHAPAERGRLATFEDLALRAAGRQYLAYLRIDADNIGAEFRSLDGDPVKTFALSQLLDTAFSSGVSNLIASRFPNLYPVYGGGDDLFIIGPWNEVLEFASEWRAEFRAISNDKLTFSAGIALAKPRQHILTKSEEAEHALNHEAKVNRDSIHALGCTMPWSKFPAVLQSARRLQQLRAERQMSSTFLHNLTELHRRWREGDSRWHSMLFYQTERNLSGAAKDFVRREFLAQGPSWTHANFAIAYAMLASNSEETN